MILCARSTSRSREHGTREQFVYSIQFVWLSIMEDTFWGNSQGALRFVGIFSWLCCSGADWLNLKREILSVKDSMEELRKLFYLFIFYHWLLRSLEFLQLRNVEFSYVIEIWHPQEFVERRRVVDMCVMWQRVPRLLHCTPDVNKWANELEVWGMAKNFNQVI